jgi:MoxR-like ATPase
MQQTEPAFAPAIAEAELSPARIPVSRLRDLESSLGEVIRGKSEVLRLSLACLISRGHLLIEDVPGVGKTTLASALARSVHFSFSRVQCTSDMMPSDIVGVTVYSTQNQEFDFKPGPVFSNLLLADEINRATPKTQSALLEAMNERQVTVDGRTHPLPDPFMVIATQNPQDHHGTYPLPESQLDRFFMRLRIGYPDRNNERDILRGSTNGHAMREVLTTAELVALQRQVEGILVDDALSDYMLTLVERTRSHDALSLGVSPRGAQALYRATQAVAMLEGRDYAIADDVKRVAIPVCAHRVALNTRSNVTRGYEAAAQIVKDILNQLEVPL